MPFLLQHHCELFITVCPSFEYSDSSLQCFIVSGGHVLGLSVFVLLCCFPPWRTSSKKRMWGISIVQVWLLPVPSLPCSLVYFSCTISSGSALKQNICFFFLQSKLLSHGEVFEKKKWSRGTWSNRDGFTFLSSFVTVFISFIQRQNTWQLHRMYVDKYRCLSLVLFTYIGVNFSSVHGDLCLEKNWTLHVGWMFSTLNSLPTLDF